MQAQGEIQRFAKYFNDHAFTDLRQVPTGTVMGAQIRLGDLTTRSKKFTKRTTPTVACDVLVKIVRAFLPHVFTPSLSNALIETQLGLRTDEMQGSTARLLERVMSYIHVIQLCVENAIDSSSVPPHEFPLVVIPLSEWKQIDYDIETIPVGSSPVASAKKRTPEQETEEVSEAMDRERETQQASQQELESAGREQLQALMTKIAELEDQIKKVAPVPTHGRVRNPDRTGRSLDYAIEIDHEDSPTKRMRMDPAQASSGNQFGLYDGPVSFTQNNGPRTIEEQQQARLHLEDCDVYEYIGYSQEIMDRLKSKKTIRLDWVFSVSQHGLADTRVAMTIGEDGKITTVKAPEPGKAKIKSIMDIRSAYEALLTCLKIYQPVLGHAFLEMYHKTIDQAYRQASFDVQLTKAYLDEQINIVLHMNDMGRGASLRFSFGVFFRVKGDYDIRAKATAKQNNTNNNNYNNNYNYNNNNNNNNNSNDKNHDKHKDKNRNRDNNNDNKRSGTKDVKNWGGGPSDQVCRNWKFGHACAFADDKGNCPYKHEGAKGAAAKSQ